MKKKSDESNTAIFKLWMYFERAYCEKEYKDDG